MAKKFYLLRHTIVCRTNAATAMMIGLGGVPEYDFPDGHPEVGQGRM
jgi:hypothetical protein